MNKLKSRMTNKENAPWHVCRVNIAVQLDEGYRTGVWRQGGGWLKQHILSEIMDCGEIELALRGNDESECSENPTVFIGVVDFVASVDAVVQEHLQSVNVTFF